MAFELKENSGWLNENLKKEQAIEDNVANAEKWSDFWGDLNIGGKLYRVSAWKRETKAGNRALSLSVEEVEEVKDKPLTSRAKPKW